VRTIVGLLFLAALAAPAYGQTPSTLSCGTFKAESAKTASGMRWTIARGAEKSTETANLRSGPRFECIQGEVLAVEFTTSAGSTFVGLYFPDGSDISYGGQIVRRNNRFVLPIQSKARMDAKFRAAFDYHCRLEMPGDPIAPASRADCISLK
jgi:hypothetical protein